MGWVTSCPDENNGTTTELQRNYGMTGWAGYCWNVSDWSVTRAPNDKEGPHGPCVKLGGTCGERRQKERQCRLPQPTSGKTRSEVEAGPDADRGDRMSHLTIRH